MVYRALVEFGDVEAGFQNILCYGLSVETIRYRKSGFQFQNILCYGLSQKLLCTFSGFCYFKTSYVMVYQKRPAACVQSR